MDCNYLISLLICFLQVAFSLHSFWSLSCMLEVFLRYDVILGCRFSFGDEICIFGIYRWDLLILSNTTEWCGQAFCWGIPHVSIPRLFLFCWQDSPESTWGISCMTGKGWLPAFLELVEDGWATSQHSAVFRTVPFLEFSTHALNYTNQPKVQRLSVLPFLEINLCIFSGGGREVSRQEGGSVSHSVLDPFENSTVQSNCFSTCPTVALGFIFLVLLS